AHTYVFRQNYPLYAVPRRWLRMAFCTTCLDGPSDPGGVVMQWGDTDSGRPRARGLVQLQSVASGSEPRRSAAAMERAAELGSDPRAAPRRRSVMIRAMNENKPRRG